MTTAPSLQEMLDQAYARIMANPDSTTAAMAAVSLSLAEVREDQAAAEWPATVAACRAHPLGQLTLDDPLTRRSFTRPRGYAGDAGMLDLIYARDWRGITPPPTHTGEALFRIVVDCRAPAAVRERRDLLAQKIDEACARKISPHILSVACGHLRELSFSRGFKSGLVGRFVGLDQDSLSLREVMRSQAATPVETIPGSIKLLFGGALAREKFDFIYSAGLYDYLDEDFGRRLTSRMFAMLRPGGRLLIANFRPGLEDVAYMEVFMNWTLIYRDDAEMLRLAADIPAGAMTEPQVFNDSRDTVAYLQLERRA